jgi:hypothetical protein
MALNRLIYEDIPHVRRKGPKLPPQPHPFKARRPHEYWVRRIGDMEECYVR